MRTASIVITIAMIIYFSLAAWGLRVQYVQCDEKHGTLVKTVFGWACIKPGAIV